jgi:hypothetical protein
MLSRFQCVKHADGFALRHYTDANRYRKKSCAGSSMDFYLECAGRVPIHRDGDGALAAPNDKVADESKAVSPDESALPPHSKFCRPLKRAGNFGWDCHPALKRWATVKRPLTRTKI